MLSDEEIDKKEKELKEMEEQIAQETEVKKEEPASEKMTSPEPVSSPTPEVKPPEATVTQEGATPLSSSKKEDDPMEWAQKKGFKTPEDMARALLQKEREFHESRQNKGNPPSTEWKPNTEWRPMPQVDPNYRYQNTYPEQPRVNTFQDLASFYPQIDPEDLKRFMPVVIDAAEAISNRKVSALQRQIEGINRTTERNNEMMSLMQDPAFQDSRVQKEIHSILDSDPSIFQRERAPLSFAYEKAMVNIARKKLQQETPSAINPNNTPPVTASGGNGSAFTGMRKITEKEFDSWSVQEQEAFIKSNGRIFPKR